MEKYANITVINIEQFCGNNISRVVKWRQDLDEMILLRTN